MRKIEGGCTFDGCENPYEARGFCHKHYKMFRKYGVPVSPGNRKFSDCKGEKSGKWVAVPSYAGMHHRVRTARGRAADHTCNDCGDPARDWSYDRRDPQQIMGNDRGHVMPYSLDVNHYEALCHGCHKYFDYAFARAERRARNGAL